MAEALSEGLCLPTGRRVSGWMGRGKGRRTGFNDVVFYEGVGGPAVEGEVGPAGGFEGPGVVEEPGGVSRKVECCVYICIMCVHRSVRQV